MSEGKVSDLDGQQPVSEHDAVVGEESLAPGGGSASGELYPPLSVRSLLSKGAGLYKRQFGVIIALTLVGHIPDFVLDFTVPLGAQSGASWPVLLAVAGLFSSVFSVAMVTVAAGDRNGESTSFGAAVSSVISRWKTVGGLLILMGILGTYLMQYIQELRLSESFPVFFAVGVLVIFFAVRLSMTFSVVMMEGKGVLKSILESYSLTGDGTDGSFGEGYGKSLWPRLLGALFVFGAFGGVLTVPLSLATGMGVLSPTLSSYMGQIVVLLYSPWMLCVFLVAYFEAREFVDKLRAGDQSTLV